MKGVVVIGGLFYVVIINGVVVYFNGKFVKEIFLSYIFGVIFVFSFFVVIGVDNNFVKIYMLDLSGSF